MNEKRTLDELRTRLAEVKTGIKALNDQYEGQYLDPDSQDGQNWTNLNGERDQLVKTVAQVQARNQRIEDISEDESQTAPGAGFNIRRPGTVSGPDIFDLSTIRASLADPGAARAELHDRAMRAVDIAKFPYQGADTAKTKTHIEGLLATVDDEHGTIAKRILRTGSPQYKEAFAKWIGSGGTQFSASMQLGTDANGGFAVPFELDPTILNTSNGSVNPYREISRVVQTTQDTWKGVTSSGVTAHRRGESGEVSDDSFTLGQPSAVTSMVDVFIPFSIQIETSWVGMSGEVAKLIQDAKDAEEVSSFTSGNGTAPNPEGLLTGATISINTAGTAVFASGDLDKTEEALPYRFQPNAEWVGNRSYYNLVRHFDSAGGPNLWLRVAEGIKHGGNTGLTLNGYGANECSAMPTAKTSGSTALVLGDFSRFLIVDMIGMRIELVQHLFATANNRPSGERGFYAYWNNTCKVLTPEAFRVLKML